MVAKFNAAAFITLVSQTFVWQQYKYQVASCLNSPALNTDCRVLFECTNIPSLDAVIVQDNRYNGQSIYDYAYSTVDYYGWGRTNMTKARGTLAAMAGQMAYSTCAANSTCYSYYTRDRNAANKALLSFTTGNLNKIIALLPTDDSRTWIPDTSFANALSIITVLPGYSNEVLGLHNAVAETAFAGKLNAMMYDQALTLKMMLSGGASMYESLLNTIVLASYTCEEDGYLKRRGTEEDDFGHDAALSTALSVKLADLRAASRLRGQARVQVWDFNMARYQEVVRHERGSVSQAMTQAGLSAWSDPRDASSAFKTTPVRPVGNRLDKRACDAQANVDWALSALTTAGTACSVASSLWSLKSIFQPSAAARQFPLMDISKSSLLEQIARDPRTNAFLTAAGIVGVACTTFGAKGAIPCYPSVSAWSDVETLQGASLTFASLVVAVATGAGAVDLGFILGCAVINLAQDSYAKVAQCCAHNCASPSCSAGAVLCAWSNLPC